MVILNFTTIIEGERGNYYRWFSL